MLLAAVAYEMIRGALYVTGTEKADRIVLSQKNPLFASLYSRAQIHH